MLNKMERQVSLCPTFPLSLFFTFICLLSLFKQLLGFSKLFWLLWQNQNNAIRIMLMLGRELPSVPKVDNFAAVEMLASKRHQNPRQVKYKSNQAWLRGGLRQLQFQGCIPIFQCCIFSSLRVFYNFSKEHISSFWLFFSLILKYCTLSVPRVFSNIATPACFRMLLAAIVPKGLANAIIGIINHHDHDTAKELCDNCQTAL